MIGKKILRGIAGTSMAAVLIFGMLNLFSYLRMQDGLMKQYETKSGELYENYQKSTEETNTDSIRIITESYQEYLEAQLQHHTEQLDTVKRHLETMYAEEKTTYSNLVKEVYYPQPEVTDDQVKEEFRTIKGISDVLSITSDVGTGGTLYYVSESGMLLAGQEIDYANSSPESDRRQRDWYLGAKNSGEIFWKDMYVDNWTGEKIVTCAEPVFGPDGSLKGIAGEDIKISYMENILKKTRNRLVKYAYVCNSSGTMFLASEEGISPQEDLEQGEYETFQNQILESEEAGIYATDQSMIGYAKIAGTDWHVCVVLDYDQAAAASRAIQGHITDFGTTQEDTLKQHLGSLVAMSIGIIVLLLLAVLIVSRKISISIARPIQKLTGQAERIGKGELDCVIENFNSGDEVGILADTLRSMTEELQQYIRNLAEVTADKERIATELSIATQIQAGMLPCIFPPFPERKEFDIFASMHPAKEVGGDFYDFFLIDENHLGVVMADVSGKGVPAALFMVIAKTLIKNYACLLDDVGEVFGVVNNQLCENNEAAMFVTAFLGVLDVETGRFEYVNAGHNPPLWQKKGGTYDWLSVKPGFVLAGMEGIQYEKQQIQMEAGDALFLYTDGVTEAVNTSMELYGEERLLHTLNQKDVRERPVNELMGALQMSLTEYAQGASQADDITMLVLRIKEF